MYYVRLIACEFAYTNRALWSRYEQEFWTLGNASGSQKSVTALSKQDYGDKSVYPPPQKKRGMAKTFISGY